jgi:uncharacterized protein YcfJ
MWKKCVSLLLVTGLTVSIAGCANQSTMEENKGAMIGGGAGAAAGGIIGGIIGSQSGHTGTGVVIGGLLGGLAGAAVGHYAYDQKRTETQAQQVYKYDPATAKATLVRVESTKTSPATVAPGGTVDLQATYTVLGPQNSTMDVTETREVRLDGELQGKPQITVQRQGGTFESKVPLVLPADAKKGKYIVATTVQSGTSSDTKETSFTVK